MLRWNCKCTDHTGKQVHCSPCCCELAVLCVLDCTAENGSRIIALEGSRTSGVSPGFGARFCPSSPSLAGLPGGVRTAERRLPPPPPPARRLTKKPPCSAMTIGANLPCSVWRPTAPCQL